MPSQKDINKEIHLDTPLPPLPTEVLDNETEVLEVYTFINLLYSEFTYIKLSETAKDAEAAAKKYRRDINNVRLRIAPMLLHSIMLLAWQIGELIKRRYPDLDHGSYEPEQDRDLDNLVRIKTDLRRRFELVCRFQKSTGGHLLTSCSGPVQIREPDMESRASTTTTMYYS